MKIGLLAPFEESIPPKKYGGTELVIYNVAEQLVKSGHEVTVFGSGNCRTSAKVIPIFKKALRGDPRMLDYKFRDVFKFLGAGLVLDALRGQRFDVIHNHLDWRFLPFSKSLETPVVTTLHGPLDVDYKQEVYRLFKDSNYVSISLSQRRPMPKLNYVANVYNGIDTNRFKFYPKPSDYFAFLGRMSPEKGPVQAIRIAKKAGVKLVMAAKVDAVDTRFFNSQVKPLIDGKQIRFLGEVDHAGKLKLLGGAKALIAPIQWEEPFGLFFIEAMACGTPVIAMNRGSVPEIVQDGKTGYVCENIRQAAASVKKIDAIDRKDCFNRVGAHFSAERMATGYLAAYEKAIRHRKR